MKRLQVFHDPSHDISIKAQFWPKGPKYLPIMGKDLLDVKSAVLLEA